jgi:uncharacterized protein YacL
MYLIWLISFLVGFFIYKNKFQKLKELWKTKWDITIWNMIIDIIIVFIILIISSFLLNTIVSFLSFDWAINEFISIWGIIFPIIMMYLWLKLLVKRHDAINDIKFINKLVEKIIVWIIITLIWLWILSLLIWISIF